MLMQRNFLLKQFPKENNFLDLDILMLQCHLIILVDFTLIGPNTLKVHQPTQSPHCSHLLFLTGHPVSAFFFYLVFRMARQRDCKVQVDDVVLLRNSFCTPFLTCVLAEPAYTRALNIYQSVFGERHPMVAKSYNSLAGLMNEQGKYVEAEVMYKKTLSLKEELLGELHPELALTLNDFAVLYSRQDKFSQVGFNTHF